jgi:adenylate cyclase
MQSESGPASSGRSHGPPEERGIRRKRRHRSVVDPGSFLEPETPLTGPIRSPSWRRFLIWLDSRLTVPGDGETRRFQKVLVVVVASVGSVATVFNAVTLFDGGLDAAGYAYIASAVVLAAGAIALLAWPQAYVPITFGLLFDVLVFPALAQIASGGLTSGLYALPWTIFAPLGAALALGSRHAIAHAILFVATVLSVAALDPYAAQIAPDTTAEALMAFNIPSLVSLGAIAAATALYLLRQVERFRIRADSLISHVLPASIANRLKAAEAPIADAFQSVTVLFADIVGFTPLSSEADPDDVVNMLNRVFSDFDDLAERHRVEKIKTIGDSYMAAAGLPEPREDHVAAMIEFAIAMLAAVEARTGLNDLPVRLRIGINTGPVVAGVIGRDRFIYDLWGDTVNVASRMESSGLAGRVQVTKAVKDAAGDGYVFDERDPIDIKGKGPTVTYLLVVDPNRR